MLAAGDYCLATSDHYIASIRYTTVRISVNHLTWHKTNY